MAEALSRAESAIGVSEPNPRVGCVIGREDGTVLGRGHTQAAGQAHAEIMALRDLQSQGHTAAGATAWVTLEPCAHHGRTPPCCDALIAAGIARVVVATSDPFPEVAGRGLGRLRTAGIAVESCGDELEQAARDLNIGFFSRHERGRPWVRIKSASSLDGRTALANGVSQWITGPEARADGHAWRRRAGAVLTGIGTALTDDPRLDVRLVPTQVQPLRVVLDSALRLPPTARLLATPGRTLVVTVDTTAPGADALRDAGAELLACPAAGGGIDLNSLVMELARRGVNELHVEAGARLNAGLLRSGLVDELLCYLAPVLLGEGPGIVGLAGLQALDQAPRFRWIAVDTFGKDLRLRARPDPTDTGFTTVGALDTLRAD